MSDSQDNSYVVTVRCPFCNETIIEAYDHSEMPDDMDEEEWENITCETYDSCDGECEHLAFRSDWAYSGSEVIGKWLWPQNSVGPSNIKKLRKQAAPYFVMIPFGFIGHTSFSLSWPLCLTV